VSARNRCRAIQQEDDELNEDSEPAEIEEPPAVDAGPRLNELLAKLEQQARKEAEDDRASVDPDDVVFPEELDDVEGWLRSAVNGVVRWNDEFDLDFETTAMLIGDTPSLLLLSYEIDTEMGEELVSLDYASSFAITEWMIEELQRRMGIAT
jgi:hypothetical protein